MIKESDQGKKIIFIDGLSWMDTKDSGLISALESFWNGWVTARAEKDVYGGRGSRNFEIPFVSLFCK